MKTSNHYWKVRYNILPLMFLAIILAISIQGKAQSGTKNTLLQMIDEDRTTIDAIAGYDERIQSHILQVAQTPEVLNKIEELQKRSQDQFRAIIGNYDRDAQSAFYEMARYPNLISDLVNNGKPSSSQVKRIVSNYPDDIHETTKKYTRPYFDVLLRIDRLNGEIDRAFQTYLEPYDENTRESVNALLAYPEIVSILVEDRDFTILLGAVYSEDPNWIVRRLAEISQELAEQNKEDLDAYKNQIQNDPEAYNEMLEASERFARENNEVRYLESSSDPIVEVRVVNCYPYWFGYPYWYSYPYWRPRPFYYHTGFYRNNYGNVIFVGLPSYHFIHWHSYRHPTLFPHLSYNYYSYYQNHYVNRYRDSHRAVPHHGFYRSIESNVINNPRVNNSNLQKIDRQRGNNIVRRPSTMESGSARRGSSGITRQREYSNSRQGTGTSGTVNRRGNESINRGENVQGSSETRSGAVNRRSTDRSKSGTSGDAVKRREYNTVNPGRSEGTINRRGSGTGNGTIRRESSPASASPEGTSSGSSRQGASVNRSKNENPRFNQSGTNRVKENASQATPRQQRSAENIGNRAASGRNGSQVERSAAPAKKEASQSKRSAAPERTVRSSERRESRAVNTQSSNRREAREKSSSKPAVSSENSNKERNARRQR